MMRPAPSAMAAVAVGIALAACSGGGRESTPNEPSATSTSLEGPSDPSDGAAVAAVALRAGQCFNAPTPEPGAALANRDITVVDCVQGHTYEAYARLRHPGDPGQEYPGDDLMLGFATDECLTRFEGYVGTAYERSTLDLVPLALPEAVWESGGRTIVCALFAADLEPLTGSMRGSGR